MPASRSSSPTKQASVAAVDGARQQETAPQNDGNVALQGLREELTSKHTAKARDTILTADAPQPCAPLPSHRAPSPRQIIAVTEAHNVELRDMMAAQKEELEEIRDEAAAARQVELDELKAAHEAELEQAREEAKTQVAEAAAAATAAATTAEAAAAAAAQEGLEGLERTAAPLGTGSGAWSSTGASVGSRGPGPS